MIKVYNAFRQLKVSDYDRSQLEELITEAENLRAFITTFSAILVAKGLVTDNDVKVLWSKAAKSDKLGTLK